MIEHEQVPFKDLTVDAGIVGVIAVAGWILYGGYHLIAWLIQHVRFV